MKRTLFVVVSALALAAVSSQAAPIYFDVIDGVYHPSSATPNTYRTNSNSATDWVTLTDAADLWRFRNTGPGVPSWNASAYDGRPTTTPPDPDLYSLLGGLSPNTAYYVAVYMIYPRAVTNLPTPGSRYGLSFSTDGRANWVTVDSYGASEIHWTDNSSELGAWKPGPGSGDSRAWQELYGAALTVTTDGSGVARIDIHAPVTLANGTTTTDRGVIDGFALDLERIPEPSVFAFVGLGLAALAIARRRRA